MENCAEMVQHSKSKKSRKTTVTEVGEPADAYASKKQQLEVSDAAPDVPAEPSETAELVSSAEDDSGKTVVGKTAKAKRKSSTPRKVVLPGDKEPPLESPPKRRKSQRIRTPARAAVTNPTRKPTKKPSEQHSAHNTAGSRSARARTTKNNRAMGQGKTGKRKAQNHEKDQDSAADEAIKEEVEDEVEKSQKENNLLGIPAESQSSEEEKESRDEKSLQLPGKKKIVHKKRPCEVCGRCYNTFYLKVHMRKHTGEKPFGCKECARSFSTDSLLRTHVQRYHGNTEELHCDVCKKVFASKGSLKIHRQIHSDEKPYKCHLCDKEFKQPGVLNEHLKTHSDDFPFICEVCGKRFKSKRSVFRHKESTHDGVRNLYMCAACGKTFHDKSSLWRHQKRHEQGYTKHVCEVCGKQFHERKVLSTHMLIHENKKPYQCEVCAKRFRHYSVLKRHMCCHTGVKPFKCDSCSRQFIHRVYMLRHKCAQKDDGTKEPTESVLVEQIHREYDVQLDVNAQDVVVFMPVASEHDLTQVPLPQHSEAGETELQMYLPLQPQEMPSEEVVIYEDVVDVPAWTT